MDWRRGWEETGWKERSRNEEWRGARKRTPEKQNDHVNSKVGLMKKNLGMLKWETEKEAKLSENDKPRVVLKKSLGLKPKQPSPHLHNQKQQKEKQRIQLPVMKKR